MDNDLKVPALSARNPLGIIALLISLIYGMSAIIVSTSVANLSVLDQRILVIFIALFPFVVLIIFAWLVVKYHRHLYSPSDFRSDQSFLDAANPLSPSKQRERLQEAADEVASATAEGEEARAQTGDTSSTSANTHQSEEPTQEPLAVKPEDETQLAKPRKSRVLEAFVAENLVFQELQNRIGGSVRRQVAFPLPNGRIAEVDGIIGVNNRSYVVEVKLTSGGEIDRRLREIKWQFQSLNDVVRKDTDEEIKLLVVLVVVGGALSTSNVTERVAKYQQIYDEKMDIIVFNYYDLLKKYGLHEMK